MLDSTFSDIFSWSTSMDTKAPAPVSHFQSIPSDIRESGDFESVSNVIISTATTIFDRTTLETDFDYSCIDGLDSQILHFPFEAFAAVCWAEATCLSMRSISNLETLDGETPLYASSSDESGSDSDECHTHDDDHLTTLIPSSDNAKNMVFSLPLESFLCREPHFTLADPKEAIGFFPVRSEHQRTKSRLGIASLCASLPTRFIKPTLTT